MLINIILGPNFSVSVQGRFSGRVPALTEDAESKNHEENCQKCFLWLVSEKQLVLRFTKGSTLNALVIVHYLLHFCFLRCSEKKALNSH